MSERQPLPPGARLTNEYVIEDILGVGGFGITYRARDLALAQTVAIKEYFPNLLATRSPTSEIQSNSKEDEETYLWGLDRFIKEARTLVRFRHDSIVRVYRTFPHNNSAYIVMEFVEGQDMEKWLRSMDGRPTQKQFDGLLPPLLDALKIVHENQILHRDVKPANIYIRDKDGNPVLLDFGSARPARSETALTNAVVSRFYSPYESYAADPKRQGPWTDIYGMSATLHRAITGEPPPEASNRVIDDDYKPLSQMPELAARYRPSFLAAIDAGLAVFPKDRPRDIETWSGALVGDTPLEFVAPTDSQAIQDSQPVWDATVAPPKRAGASRKVAGGVLALFVLGAAGGIGYHLTRLPEPSGEIVSSNSAAEVRAADTPSVASLVPGDGLPSSARPEEIKIATLEPEIPALEVRPGEIVPREAAPRPDAATPPSSAALSRENLLRVPHDASDPPPRLQSLAIASDNLVVATGLGRNADALWIWTGDPAAPKRIVTPNMRPLTVALHPGRPIAAVVGHSDSVEVFDLAKGERLTTSKFLGSIRRITPYLLTSVDLLPDGDMVLAAARFRSTAIISERDRAGLWNWRNGTLEREFEGSIATASRDGRRIATGVEGVADDPEKLTVRLYEKDGDWRQIKVFDGPERRITALLFSRDGRRIFVANAGETIRVIDTAEEKASEINTDRKYHSGGVAALALSRDGRLLAAAGGQQVTLWDAERLEFIAAFDAAPELSGDALPSDVGRLKSVAFFPNGLTIAASGDRGGVRIWKIPEAARRISQRDP